MHEHSGRVAGCRIGRGLLLFCVCLLWTWTLFNGTMTTFCIKVMFFICIPRSFWFCRRSIRGWRTQAQFRRQTKFVWKFQAEVMQQHWVVTSGKFRNRNCQWNLNVWYQVIPVLSRDMYSTSNRWHNVILVMNSEADNALVMLMLDQLVHIQDGSTSLSKSRRGLTA